MGSFCYLINNEKKIRVEAYQHSASGNEINSLTNEENMILFMEYCRHNNLHFQCVHDSFFDRAMSENEIVKWIDFDKNYLQKTL